MGFVFCGGYLVLSSVLRFRSCFACLAVYVLCQASCCMTHMVLCVSRFVLCAACCLGAVVCRASCCVPHAGDCRIYQSTPYTSHNHIMNHVDLGRTVLRSPCPLFRLSLASFWSG